MTLDFFYKVLENSAQHDAIIYECNRTSFIHLLHLIGESKKILARKNVLAGETVALCADFTPNSIAMLFALIENKNIIVPLNRYDLNEKQKKINIAHVEHIIEINKNDEIHIEQNLIDVTPKLYEYLREMDKTGLVLFTSGTSGEPKAAVHDFFKLLEKFKRKTKVLRTVNFLLFDHWGGLNTMFHALSNGSVILTLQDRNPHTVCSFIEKYKIELLPTSPTFLNFIIMSEAYKKFDLSSLKMITYGTEPMPPSTLSRLVNIFPEVSFQQTYGLIELGVLRSKSKGNNSLWVKVGGDGYETRVIDNLLEIKADSAMLGYLNAPSPFTPDGWFKTGDMVETDGEYIKILGRKSELINVGGEKVYPVEIEDVIISMANIAAVTVFAEKNLIVGKIICAKVALVQHEDKSKIISRVKKYCRERLSPHKVPVKVIIVDEISEMHTPRFKTKKYIG
jgi:acyl-CoA synthetase (AMP-forming)/AMP-acid ligase II